MQFKFKGALHSGGLLLAALRNGGITFRFEKVGATGILRLKSGTAKKLRRIWCFFAPLAHTCVNLSLTKFPWIITSIALKFGDLRSCFLSTKFV